MKKKKPLKRFLGFFNPEGTKKYVTQITLILVSLFIATSVDRWREASKNKDKLREYLKAIQVDLKEEIETSQLNFKDCNRDLDCLTKTLHYIRIPHDDSLKLALANFSEVYWRGVFRAFPPSTFESMSASGDASLLKDLALRNKLAAVFAFRQNVVKKDLEQYDQQVEICAKELGQHLDLTRLLYNETYSKACILDRTGFLKSPHNEVVQLLRTANLRSFHLENALEDLKIAQKDLETFLSSL